MSDLDTSLEIIEALDFEHQPRCEHQGHGKGHPAHPGDEPAKYLVRRFYCPDCGADPGSKEIYLCGPVYEIAAVRGINCFRCHRNFPRETFWLLLAVLP